METETKKKSNKKKFDEAKNLLNEVLQDWNEDEVEDYESSLSFDALVIEVNSIRLKEVKLISCGLCEEVGDEEKMYKVGNNALCDSCFKKV